MVNACPRNIPGQVNYLPGNANTGIFFKARMSAFIMAVGALSVSLGTEKLVLRKIDYKQFKRSLKNMVANAYPVSMLMRIHHWNLFANEVMYSNSHGISELKRGIGAGSVRASIEQKSWPINMAGIAFRIITRTPNLCFGGDAPMGMSGRQSMIISFMVIGARSAVNPGVRDYAGQFLKLCMIGRFQVPGQIGWLDLKDHRLRLMAIARICGSVLNTRVNSTIWT